MPEIQNVEQLLLLSGSEFIDAAYRALLGRTPDPAGEIYYSRKLSDGTSRAAVIYQLALSKESRALGPNILGLDELIAQQKRLKHWFWGALNRNRRIERQTTKLENELSLISKRLTQLRIESSDRFAGLDALVSQSNGVAHVRSITDSRSGGDAQPWTDATALSQPARQIFRRLMKASISRKIA